MENLEIGQIYSEWPDEFNESMGKTNALCIALFSCDKELLYATPVMLSLFKGEAHNSFINPTFDKLLEIKSSDSHIFQGFLKIGNLTSMNVSINANIFLKEDKLLVIGGTDITEVIVQNKSLHRLNYQINNLQRELLKEKSNLENTLNQLNETNTILKQANNTKDKFFSIIAHDLKSPFNSIIGFSEILGEQIKKRDYEKIDKYAHIIGESSKRAMELLTNLMEWSRSQTGTMEFNPVNLEIVDLINELIVFYEEIAGQKSITIKKVLHHNKTVFCDKAMISTIFRNLISNAIKFTMPGGEIIITAKEEQNQIIFSVSDTGVGISKDGIEKLFQIDKSYSTPGTNKEKGTGLGLILCKEFVEKHNGKIWIESVVDIGSIFSFSLPTKSDKR